MGHITEALDETVSSEIQYLLDWYFEISDGLTRVLNGQCVKIGWQNLKAWSELKREIVYPHEYAILQEIDAAYCSETNKELEEARARLNDQDGSP